MIVSKTAEIDAFVKSPPAHVRVVLIHGQDRARVHQRADQIARTRLSDLDDPFSSAKLTLSELDGDMSRLGDELTAMSMLGDKRLVRLRMDGEGRVGQALAAVVKDHAAGTYNPDTLLIIEAEALGKESKLRQAAEKDTACAVLPCYDPDARDIATLVRQTLQAAQVRLAPDALDRLLGLVPSDYGLLMSELEKLALYARPGEELTVEDVVAIMTNGSEGDIYAAAFSAFSGGLREACQDMQKAQDGGIPAASVLRAVSSHTLRLRRAQAYVADGKTREQATKSVGIFWKQERGFLGQLADWPAEKLQKLGSDLRGYEIRIKSTGQPDTAWAERSVMTVAQRTRRR